jgi:cobalamin biosynthesis protein CobT
LDVIQSVSDAGRNRSASSLTDAENNKRHFRRERVHVLIATSLGKLQSPNAKRRYHVNPRAHSRDLANLSRSEANLIHEDDEEEEEGEGEDGEGDGEGDETEETEGGGGEGESGENDEAKDDVGQLYILPPPLACLYN